MIKDRRYVILACLVFLLFLGVKTAAGEDYVKNIETGEADIMFGRTELPPVAYLCVEFKNNGDKGISNLDFEISYYDKDGYPIKKAVVKNALTEEIPKKESRRYKIRLKGNIVNIDNAQYPYAQQNEVSEFDIKVISVKFSRT